MRRSHLALLLVLGAPVALYAAVIVPRAIPARTDEPTSPAAYFPTAVGTRWVYQVTQYRFEEVRDWEEIEKVTGITNGHEKIVTVRQFGGHALYPIMEWGVSNSGLRRRWVPDPECILEGEQPTRWSLLIPTRVAPGENWIAEREGSRSKTVLTVAGWETIHVPAGAYKTLRVDIEIIQSDHDGKPALTITGAQWYAPGVGCVKLELKCDLALFEVVRELMSFSTPPGQ
jgi:hypothetical protein